MTAKSKIPPHVIDSLFELLKPFHNIAVHMYLLLSNFDEIIVNKSQIIQIFFQYFRLHGIINSMKREIAFIGLGGNIGDSVKTIFSAVQKIEQIPQIFDLKCSNFYKTSPVSQIPQNDYVNAVCYLKTTLGAEDLLFELQRIEKELGRVSKPKEAPRIIDLDILFLAKL